MSGTSTDFGAITPSAEGNGTNGAAPAEAGWPVPEFKYRLGDNPLWQDFQDVMNENRRADIAEANRLADLELEKVERAYPRPHSAGLSSRGMAECHRRRRDNARNPRLHQQKQRQVRLNHRSRLQALLGSVAIHL